MADQKKGQIQIFAKNIKGVSHGGILEESKFTRNVAGGNHIQNGGNGVNNGKNKDRKPSLELRVLKVDGPFDPEQNGRKADVIEKGKKYNFKVTQYNRTATKEEIKNLKWGFQYDDGTIAFAPQVTGKEIVSNYVPNEVQATKLTVYAFFKAPNKNASVEVKVRINHGGAFLFIVTDELLPSGKLVRKVIVPPPKKIFDYFKSNRFEMFGDIATNPFSNISIGEHASGIKPSPYLSASTLPHGAPNINGTPQYIDIKKAEAAGCKIYSTEEIVADLKRLKEQAPNAETKARLGKVINAVGGFENEVLIKGPIPASAIKSSSAMKLTKGLRVLNVIGIVITAYDLEQATEKSIQQNSIKPISAEVIRQVGDGVVQLLVQKLEELLVLRLELKLVLEQLLQGRWGQLYLELLVISVPIGLLTKLMKIKNLIMFTLFSKQYRYDFYLPSELFFSISEIKNITIKALFLDKALIFKEIKIQKISDYLHYISIFFKKEEDLEVFKEYLLMYKELIPPWLAFPNYIYMYISWDQGYQYDYCIKNWLPYWKSLNTQQKQLYMKKYNCPTEWEEWFMENKL